MISQPSGIVSVAPVPPPTTEILPSKTAEPGLYRGCGIFDCALVCRVHNTCRKIVILDRFDRLSDGIALPTDRMVWPFH